MRKLPRAGAIERMPYLLWKSRSLLGATVLLSGWLLFGTRLAMPASPVSYLSLCPEKLSVISEGSKWFSFVNLADSKPQMIILLEKPPNWSGCETQKLPLSADQVRWIRPVSSEEASRFKQGIILSAPIGSAINKWNPQPLVEEPTDTAAESKATFNHPNSGAATQRKLSTWLWDPKLWQNENRTLLWSQLAEAYINRIYISVPIDPAAQKPVCLETLKAFVREAKKRELSVWAVDGDPRAVLNQERQAFAERAAIYKRYNQAVPLEERLDGVQYDIEPYLIPGFDLNPTVGYQAYVETIALIHSQLGMPLEVVLPFWFAHGRSTRDGFLEALAPLIDSVVVMDYRTRPEQIKQLGEPFLNWGERFDKPIQIALEAGTLLDEQHLIYRPAQTGEVWQLMLNKEPVLVLLNKPAINPFGMSFAYSHQAVVPSSNLTFNQDVLGLVRLLPELQSHFSAWPHYQGLALHQYLEISRNPAAH